MLGEKDSKLKILDDTISNIEKNYGKGSIMKLGDGVIIPVEAISTGSLSLDWAWEVFPAAELLKSMVPSRREKPHCVCILLPKPKRLAV